MYDGIEDVEGFAVHEVEVDGKKRYVDCKRAYNEPVDNCPLCRSGMSQRAKLFVPVYDIAANQVKIWERGKKFFNQMSQLCNRYATNEPLCSHIFEIERSGKPNDTQTTYGIYEVGCDNTTLDDLPDLPELIGGLVLDKTPEEMEYFLKHGSFEDGHSTVANSADEDLPFRRGGSENATRRTPNRGERF